MGMRELPAGLSAQAIAGFGSHHPWDPSDLLRCIKHCNQHGITTSTLRRRMKGRSPEWDRLLPEWDNLVALLHHEQETRADFMAPLTYSEMKRVIHGGITCRLCDGSGRGVECRKCKGTGRRSGGRCRADDCYRGAAPCTSCRARGYVVPNPEAASA